MKNMIFAILIMVSSSVALGEGGKAVVKVNGMVCAFCANSIEKKFKKMDEVKDIHVDLDSKQVTISYKDGKSLPEEKVRQIITGSGYSVSSIEASE